MMLPYLCFSSVIIHISQSIIASHHIQIYIYTNFPSHSFFHIQPTPMETSCLPSRIPILRLLDHQIPIRQPHEQILDQRHPAITVKVNHPQTKSRNTGEEKLTATTQQLRPPRTPAAASPAQTQAQTKWAAPRCSKSPSWRTRQTPGARSPEAGRATWRPWRQTAA